MRYMSIAAIALALLSFTDARAQSQGAVYQYNPGAKAFTGSTEKTLAFSGGFNNPQFGAADLNHDNIKDLIVYERYPNRIRTFINTAATGPSNYVYAPQYEVNMPPVSQFFIMKDYNADGIIDLFTYQADVVSFVAYKGYYQGSELKFNKYKPLIANSGFGPLNAYVQPGDIPAVEDVDNDGDLDFLSFGVLGQTITLYRNCQKELLQANDSITLCLADNCWGRMFQGFDRTYNLNYNCAQNGVINNCKTTLHTGNAMCLLDVEGDGDLDLLDGNISFSDVQLVRNGRSVYGKDTMISQDTIWDSNGVPLSLNVWPATFYFDADNDGKKDLVFAPNAENTSENYKCIVLFKNTGTASVPSFTYQGDSFLVDKTIDAGSSSYPFLYDYDKDGKADLFVGSDGYFQQSGNLRSKISYYKNTSTVGNISFSLQTNDFLSLFGQNYRGASIAIGDINNDGKDDLLLGHYDGTISYFKNNASSAAVQPVWQLVDNVAKDISNNDIDAGLFSAPAIYDVNKDGRNDLVIGNQTGYLYYYENAGTSGQFKLDYKTDQLGGVKADPNNLFSGFSTPFIGKMDNTNIDFLTVGSNSGVFYRFSGFQTGNTQVMYPRVDSAYSLINPGLRSAPAIADIDGDGKYDLVAGNYLGGLSIYRQAMNVTGVENTAVGTCNIYPNPAKRELYVVWNDAFTSSGRLHARLVNTLGQVVYESDIRSQLGEARLDLPELNTGIYFFELIAGENHYSAPVSIAH